jgi:hypothetical protein
MGAARQKAKPRWEAESELEASEFQSAALRAALKKKKFFRI